jgi:hypothetical protein
LGLSQVFGFIKQSGGHVKIYSEVGEGTTVKLYLPRYRGSENVVDERLESHQLPQGRSELVLVVEDDPDVRDYTVEMVGDLGYSVLSASDGATALRLLDSNREVSLLFTDVGLPGGMKWSPTRRTSAATATAAESPLHDRLRPKRHRPSGTPRSGRRGHLQAVHLLRSCDKDPPSIRGLGASGRSPTKRLWIGQTASPSSWKTPFIATRMAW